jgi:cell division septal protein FtsQ
MSPNAPASFAPPLHFQRGDNGMRLKKVRKTGSPLFKQAIISFVLAAVAFLSVHEIYLFVITWTKLEIRDVRVSCADESVRADVVRFLEGTHWGNILLLDLAKVRVRLEALPWVKEARLRKVFPASLQIGLVPRTPAALLRRDTLMLIDREGVELPTAEPGAFPGLPLLFDGAGFVEDRADKLRRAWECLDGLADAERLDVESIDLTDPLNAVLKLRSEPTRVLLGDAGFGPRIADFLKNRERWTRQFGPLEYVDLRFDDRVYLKPAALTASADTPSLKEAR